MPGRVLGQKHCMLVEEALGLSALGAAYALKLDDEIGSMECGKIPDFAILGQDPQAFAPTDLIDIPVHGAVSGGQVHFV